jgi:hypothetical protein
VRDVWTTDEVEIFCSERFERSVNPVSIDLLVVVDYPDEISAR